MKKILIVCMCALLTLTFVACGTQTTSEAPEKITKVRLGEVTHSVFYAPQYAAIALGYFEDEGIEIELSNLQGADKVMSALLSNQIDIGFCGPEASIYVYNEGREDYPQVFAQMTQRDGSFLVGKEKVDEFNWDQLKGKTVIPGRRGGVPYMTFEYLLKEKGLNPETDLILDDSIQFSLMAGAFSGSDAEYVTLFEPTASMIEAEEKGYILTSVGEETGDIPYTAYCAKSSYIAENEELIEKFTKAITKGLKWVEEHTSDEIAELIVDSFPDTDVAMLSSSVERYKSIDAWKIDPAMTKESFERLQDIMVEAGELEVRAPFEKIVNNTFCDKLNK